MTELATAPTTLEERVRGVIGAEMATDRPLTLACEGLPENSEGRMLSTYEWGLLDWAALAGMAFGIARMEEPCESLESVARRANAVALSIFREDYEPLRFADRQTGGRAQ
jgi:hypothetical protein